jgi:hypothetical protein
MLRGSCLCGEVKYEINGPLFDVRNCHCSICRKAHGAAFRSRASVKAEDFQYLQGEHLIASYESSPGTYRTFCSKCGSRLITRFNAFPEFFGLPLAGLDDDPGVKPSAHVHVASKAVWFDITDTLPQHPEGPP